jgi:hypothetical protein
MLTTLPVEARFRRHSRDNRDDGDGQPDESHHSFL